MNARDRIVCVAVVFATIAMLLAILADFVFPVVCVEHGVVKAITALNYRDATVLLEDGREVSVNQATLKPGSQICLRKARK